MKMENVPYVYAEDSSGGNSKVIVSETDAQMSTAPKIQLRAIHDLRNCPVRYQQRHAD